MKYRTFFFFVEGKLHQHLYSITDDEIVKIKYNVYDRNYMYRGIGQERPSEPNNA